MDICVVGIFGIPISEHKLFVNWSQIVLDPKRTQAKRKGNQRSFPMRQLIILLSLFLMVLFQSAYCILNDKVDYPIRIENLDLLVRFLYQENPSTLDSLDHKKYFCLLLLNLEPNF